MLYSLDSIVDSANYGLDIIHENIKANIHHAHLDAWVNNDIRCRKAHEKFRTASFLEQNDPVKKLTHDETIMCMTHRGLCDFLQKIPNTHKVFISEEYGVIKLHALTHFPGMNKNRMLEYDYEHQFKEAFEMVKPLSIIAIFQFTHVYFTPKQENKVPNNQKLTEKA